MIFKDIKDMTLGELYIHQIEVDANRAQLILLIGDEEKKIHGFQRGIDGSEKLKARYEEELKKLDAEESVILEKLFSERLSGNDNAVREVLAKYIDKNMPKFQEKIKKLEKEVDEFYG